MDEVTRGECLESKSRKPKIWPLNHQSRAAGDIVDEPGENNVLKLREDTFSSEVTKGAERPIFRCIQEGSLGKKIQWISPTRNVSVLICGLNWIDLNWGINRNTELKKIFFNSFSFTAKLRGVYRDFPSAPFHMQSFPHYQHPPTLHHRGTFATTDEPTPTHHNHTTSIVYHRGHTWCCTFYGFESL